MRGRTVASFIKAGCPVELEAEQSPCRRSSRSLIPPSLKSFVRCGSKVVVAFTHRDVRSGRKAGIGWPFVHALPNGT